MLASIPSHNALTPHVGGSPHQAVLYNASSVSYSSFGSDALSPTSAQMPQTRLPFLWMAITSPGVSPVLLTDRDPLLGFDDLLKELTAFSEIR